MLLCAKPGSIRCSDFPVRCSFIRVFPVRGVTEDVEKILRFLPDCVFPEDDDLTEVFLTLFARLGSCLASSSPDACDLLKANSVFLEILSCYMSACAKSGRAPAENLMYSPAREVCEYINGHFASDCSLKKLAEIVHLSPNHLHTVFKASVGMTPYEYTVAKRIDRAGTLIITGEKSMLDIALETGFCSQSHFNKVFKEKTGLTPAEYRKKIWDRY